MSGFLAAGIVLVGVSVGAVAYFAGEGASAGARAPEAALGFVPRSAGLIGHVDLRSIASSPLGDTWAEGLKERKPIAAIEDLRESTGVDVLEDVDALTFSVSSQKAARGQERWGMAVTGSFDFDGLVKKLSEQEKDVKKETHAGTTLYLLTGPAEPPGKTGASEAPRTFAMAHPDDATLLVGDAGYLREMLDTRDRGEEPAAALLEGWGYGGLEAETFWIAGNPPGFLDSMVSRGTELPPPLRSFAITGRLDSDVVLKARGKATDPDSAQKLAEVARGFVALGRLREGSASQGERGRMFARIAESVQIDQLAEEIE
ncbi:MAG: hypothetical protein ACRD21_17995, partial [Vicinamibacteria bacterium]